MPDITFVNSPKTEEERLKMTAKVVGQGFYQKHGFVILPELTDEIDPTSLVIYPMEPSFASIDTQKYASMWHRVEADFWQELERYFHGVTDTHGAIEVYISRYGTVSSGLMNNPFDDENVLFYLRSDADLGHLAAMIINKILFSERKKLGITWTKREALMDFIMTRPVMKKLFPKFDPIYHQLSKVPLTIRRESERYVRSLGIAPITKELDVINGKIIINEVVVAKELTKQEKEIMKKMIKMVGEIVSYDELADIIWGEGEFKTFWAINKMMQRLRGRLVKLGIDGKRIEAIRGQGYLLR